MCYECNCMKSEKSQTLSLMFSYGVKCGKKLLETIVPLEKCIQLNVYSHYIKNLWVNSLTLFLEFWWIELAILRIQIKGYQIVIFNFEDISKIKIVLYQTLITFFHTSKPISSRMLVETSHIDGFYMLYGPLTLSGSLVIVKIEYGC